MSKKKHALMAGTFEIRAKGSGITEVLIYGDIGPSWNEGNVLAAQFVKDLQNVEATTINARINSYGGAVSDALAIYNALQRHPATVNTFVDGVAVSAASLVAMAGKTLIMAENAVMMIHGPMAMAAGNANTMREMADILDKYAQAMAPSYASKTGKQASEMLALLTDGQDHWYTATEAQAAGFADEVSAPMQIAAHFDFGRYRGVPAAAAAFQRSQIMDTTITAAPQPAAASQQVTASAVAVPAPQPTLPVATAPAPPLAVVPAPQGRTKEQIAEIKATFAPFMAQPAVATVYGTILEDPAVTVQAAREQLLTTLGEGARPANPSGHHFQMGETEAQKFVDACTVAIMARAGYATKEQRATLGQNPYRGHKMLDFARASLDRISYNTRGIGQMDIVAAAFTQGTSDFPVLLENVMHKTLQAAYGTTPDTWSRFCSVGSVTDFRAANRYRLGSFGNLDSLNELGEFHNKSIPDGEKASITAATKGNIINLSRQAIINDDLGAFVSLAAGIGRAARRTIEVDVYALLAQNSGAGPTLTDTGILFNTTATTTAGGHANKAASGAVPTVTTIAAGRTAMATQKDVGGNDFLDLQPMIFLSNIGNGDTARVVNDSLYDTEVTSKFQVPNKVKGLFREVIGSPRILTTYWYMFADPSVAPTIEVAFLDGNQEPYIEMQQGFTVDGARWKVRLDYGTAVIDYRGAYANPGA